MEEGELKMNDKKKLRIIKLLQNGNKNVPICNLCKLCNTHQH